MCLHFKVFLAVISTEIVLFHSCECVVTMLRLQLRQSGDSRRFRQRPLPCLHFILHLLRGCGGVEEFRIVYLLYKLFRAVFA